MIELEKTGKIKGHSVVVEVTYEHDGYSAVHYVDGVEVNTVDAARCYATLGRIPSPEDGARRALAEEWQNRVDDMSVAD